ncbi:uncharacterized protein PV07_12677 [Cladophialophora immunda]|uniref:RING-type domain-containing protein n=1 Tax=Cladophialophora immunda TaxID=569365 RepID=A0A0D2AAX1_9EURO|nr:uncharacterized protein PV07_12677 [Cladophialophora immunda]KIW21912.1 hypothetical protein PV07_12677 [Cladophialophora immunda]
MPPCRHRGWLEVADGHDTLASNGHGFTLHVSDRLDRLVEGLPYPPEQRPSLVLMLGAIRRDKALRALQGSRGECVRDFSHHADVELVLDSRTRSSQRPILFASGHQTKGLSSSEAGTVARCHRTLDLDMADAHGTSWSQAGKWPADLLSARLVAPLADVVCVFLSDFSSLEKASERLEAWIRLGAPSSLPDSVRPYLILVEDEVPTRRRRADVVRERLSRWCQGSIASVFSGQITVELPKHCSSRRSREYAPLRKAIQDQVQQSERARQETGTLFSARHMAAFFNRQLGHFRSARLEPFNFLHATRLHDPVPGQLSDSLADFIKDFRTRGSLSCLAVPLVAACLFLNHYCTTRSLFQPADVFAAFYAGPCLAAFERTAPGRGEGSLSPQTLRYLTEEKFRALFETWQAGSAGVRELHRRCLRRLKGHWQKYRTELACRRCLVAWAPEYRLTCGHRLCEACVRAEGTNSKTDPCTYRIATCPLCGSDTGEAVIYVKPTLSGHRILSIDGGGCRGIIPLTFLGELEQRLGIPGIAHRAFDIVFGTSSGGIDCVGVFHQGWSIRHCQTLFQSVARNIFVRQVTRRPRVMPNVQQAVVNFLRETLYPAEVINRALQSAFGLATLLDDPTSFAARYGIKLGLTAATVGGPMQKILFTNYNGFGHRLKECGTDRLLS